MFATLILPGIPWPLFWSFCALAIIIQGISKSGFAGGAGILSLPLMMLVMPVDKVAATLLPLLILCDFNAIYHHWNNKDWSLIRKLLGPVLVGIVLGAAVWWYIGREGVEHFSPWIKRFVGVIAILFAVYIVAKERSLRWAATRHPGLGTRWAAGLSAGFSSTIAHAAGPIVSLYFWSQGMGKSLFVGTVAWTFTIINLAKLPFYGAVGLIDATVLYFDLFLIPFIPLGSWLGHWMHHRISEGFFTKIIFVLTILAALQLLFNFNVIQWLMASWLF